MFMQFDILQSLTLKDKRYKQKAWITSYKTEIEILANMELVGLWTTWPWFQEKDEQIT